MVEKSGYLNDKIQSFEVSSTNNVCIKNRKTLAPPKETTYEPVQMGTNTHELPVVTRGMMNRVLKCQTDDVSLMNEMLASCGGKIKAKMDHSSFKCNKVEQYSTTMVSNIFKLLGKTVGGNKLEQSDSVDASEMTMHSCNYKEILKEKQERDSIDTHSNFSKGGGGSEEKNKSLHDRMYQNLPPGWMIRNSRSKNRPYYVHPDFGSTWQIPATETERSTDIISQSSIVSNTNMNSMIGNGLSPIILIKRKDQGRNVLHTSKRKRIRSGTVELKHDNKFNDLKNIIKRPKKRITSDSTFTEDVIDSQVSDLKTYPDIFKYTSTDSGSTMGYKNHPICSLQSLTFTQKRVVNRYSARNITSMQKR